MKEAYFINKNKFLMTLGELLKIFRLYDALVFFFLNSKVKNWRKNESISNFPQFTCENLKDFKIAIF